MAAAAGPRNRAAARAAGGRQDQAASAAVPGARRSSPRAVRPTRRNRAPRSSSKFSRKLRMSQLQLPIRHHSSSTTISLVCSNGGGLSQMRQPRSQQRARHWRASAQSITPWLLSLGQHDLDLHAAQRGQRQRGDQPLVGQEIGRRMRTDAGRAQATASMARNSIFWMSASGPEVTTRAGGRPAGSIGGEPDLAGKPSPVTNAQSSREGLRELADHRPVEPELRIPHRPARLRRRSRSPRRCSSRR